VRPIWPHRVSRTKLNKHVWIVGTDTGKDVVYSRLRIDKSGPGYLHFPIGGAFDQTYFDQLTSEVVRTRYQYGRPYRVWLLPPGKRNEALDCTVYALAARHATRIPLLLPRLDSSSTSDDEVDKTPPADDEAGIEVGVEPPPRREIDPNMLHQGLLEARRPRGGIYGGPRRGGWF
jgi:phage terminase large subunit GpA-like protein